MHRRTACFTISLLLLSSCAFVEPPPPAASRSVRVKALADPTLMKDDPRWRTTVRELVEAASDFFDREFGIRFVVEKIAPWPQTARTPSMRRLMETLKKEVPLSDRTGSYDLVIGFIGQPVDIYGTGLARADRIGDCEEGLGNYVTTYVSGMFRHTPSDSDLDPDVVALIHEFGHIFGAAHTDDPLSIMYRDFDYRTDFDEKSREVILQNRACPFGKG